MIFDSADNAGPDMVELDTEVDGSIRLFATPLHPKWHLHTASGLLHADSAIEIGFGRNEGVAGRRETHTTNTYVLKLALYDGRAARLIHDVNDDGHPVDITGRPAAIHRLPARTGPDRNFHPILNEAVVSLKHSHPRVLRERWPSGGYAIEPRGRANPELPACEYSYTES